MLKNLTIAFLAVLLCSESLAQATPSIVGTWQLVKYEDRKADGSVTFPFGERPLGYFVYDVTGHLSIQIMKTPAMKPFAGMRDGSGDPAQFREGFLSYMAYFGTYSVDVAKGTVTHHIEGSLRPDYTHTDQVRSFRIEGNRLIIEIRQNDLYQLRELIRMT